MRKFVIIFAILVNSVLLLSYFGHPSQKHFDEFEWDSNTLVLEWSQRLWLKGEEIRIGSTKLYANGYELVCHCKKPAQSLTFKNGKLSALCEDHGIKRARKDVPESHGKRSTVTAKEFNQGK